MMIRRTLPPAAAPIYCRDIANGFAGILRGNGEVDRFEGEIREYFGVRHSFTLSSGRAALTVILRALRPLRPERDVVVIPAYTCYSVAASVVRAGLSLRLCDVDARTLDFNYAELQDIISHDSNEILAIIPAHLFGLPADMDRLKEITAGRDIFLVEDAAQALGGECRGKKLGRGGDVGFFSLGRGKPLTTVEGGVIITGRDDIAREIEKQVKGMKQSPMAPLIVKALLLALFIHPRLYWFPKHLPFLKIGETIYDEEFELRRLSPFQAGLAKGWQRRIEQLKRARRERALKFLAIGRSGAFHSYVSDEDTLPELLRFPLLSLKAGLGASREGCDMMDRLGIVPYYPTSIGEIRELHGRFAGQRYPGSERAAAHLITLPIHPLVSDADAERIIRFFESTG